uniref:Uncharacterized protein n=1 Tax=Anguilla anguilla TaxID=7936 RepID=A0A0E9VD76_ANGAN
MLSKCGENANGILFLACIIHEFSSASIDFGTHWNLVSDTDHLVLFSLQNCLIRGVLCL